MKPEQRELTESDRGFLQTYTNASWCRELFPAMFFGFLFLSTIAFAILFSLWKGVASFFDIADAQSYQSTFIALSAILAGAYIVPTIIQEIKTLRSDKNKEFNKKLKQDLKNNVAKVETFKVTAAIEIEEYEDEGAGFLLGLKDGRVLCVIGQDFYDYAQDVEGAIKEGAKDNRDLFPQTSIQYITAPETGVRLDIQGNGKPLKVRSIIKHRDEEFSKKGVYQGPMTDTFYDGSLDNIIKKFGYKEKKLEIKKAKG